MTGQERAEINQRSRVVLAEILDDPAVREMLRKFDREERPDDAHVPLAAEWMGGEA